MVTCQAGRCAWDIAAAAAVVEPELERPEGRARRVDVLLSERTDELGPVEQARLLLWRQPVLHIPVLQDLGQPAAATVLAREVCDDLLLRRASGEEKCERIPKDAAQPRHGADCIVESCRFLLTGADSPNGCSTALTTQGTRSGS
jgi:hypothetical protein